MRKHNILVILFLLLLVACNTGNTQTSEPPQAAQPTDEAMMTRMSATSTVIPTASIPTDIPTIANTLASTATPFLSTPSPWPTVPFIITPNADQLTRWREYEKALAEKFISHHIPEDVLCEWVLLGQSAQEVYVWANCKSIPAPYRKDPVS